MATVPYIRQSWTDGAGGGTPLSAARLNVIEAGINDVSYAPSVRAFHNAAQSITSGVSTALAFNSERFDDAGNATDTQHDNVTNNSRLTAKYAGKYQITGNVQFGTNATGSRQVTIRVNGTTIIAAAKVPVSSATETTILNVTTEYLLNVNDYVELVVLQNSGGALNVELGANWSPEFMMERVA